MTAIATAASRTFATRPAAVAGVSPRPAEAPSGETSVRSTQEQAAVFEAGAVGRTGPARDVADFVGSYVGTDGNKMNISLGADGRLTMNGQFKDPSLPNATVAYGREMPDHREAAVTENTEFRHPWIHFGRADKVKTTTGARFENGTFTYKQVQERDIQLGRDQRTENVDSFRLDGDTLHMTYARRTQEGGLLGWGSPTDDVIEVAFRRVQ